MDKRLDHLQVFLAKADGRDKAGRITQYLCRFLVGTCALLLQRNLSHEREDTVMHFQIKCRSVQTALSDARRTHRWLKQIGMVRGLAAMAKATLHIPLWEWLNVVSKGFLSLFLTIDHIAWLREVKIVEGDSKAVVRFNLRFLLIANALQTLYQMLIYRKGLKEEDEEKRAATLKRTKLEFFRHMFLCVQNAHNSGLYETHDAISGALGVATSTYDATKLWPT